MNTLPAALIADLKAAAPGGCVLKESANPNGVITAWFEVAKTSDLAKVGQVLKSAKARLSTVTAMQPKTPEDEDSEEEIETIISLNGSPYDGTSYQILYHFDLDGDTLTVSVFLPE